MRRLELTLSGRHIRHPEHLLTYKLLYKNCGYGMFLLDTRTGYWYPTPEPLESLNLKARYGNKSYLLSAIRRELQKRCLYTNECIFNEIRRILQAKSILGRMRPKIELT